MEPALEELSKQQLLALLKEREQPVLEKKNLRLEEENKRLEEELAYYKAQVALYQRIAVGQKRERFEAEATQLPLPFEVPAQEHEEQELLVAEQISYVRRKQSAHKGRTPLPAHLPVEEVEIHPEGDLTQMVCIGKEVTEELECEPARFFIRRYIRYKYAHQDQEGVSIGTLPERVIDKGMAGAGLLASILVDKYMDHLPLYRQKQRFARENIPIASSTIEGWAKQALERLEPLYQQLLFDIQAKGYLQADETPI